MMREYNPTELIGIAAKFQGKARQSIQAWLVQLWDMGCDGISLTGQEAEKMNNITKYPALWQCLYGVWGVQGIQSFVDWTILAAGRLGAMRGSPWACGTLEIHRGGATNC